MKLRPISFPWLAALVIMISFAHIVATWKHLYFYYEWLDIPMHFLCGVWISLMVLLYTETPERRFFEHISQLDRLILGVSLTLLIGVSWEVFEGSVGMLVGHEMNEVLDTLSDVLNGFIGGLVGTAIVVARGYNKAT